jgi:hypothetical protein
VAKHQVILKGISSQIQEAPLHAKVITAVGMVDQLPVMMAAVIASVGVMLFAAKPIGDFVDAHPSVKVLALAFLAFIVYAVASIGKK